METEKTRSQELPENAFRELREGEDYEPILSPSKEYGEVNAWSLTWGILMAVLFSAATAYLGLKVGQVFEAAIPITIIAIGISAAAKRRHALAENVIIQSIGASSGMIVAGAIFTLPALYILQAKYPDMTVSFMQVFLSSLLGGVLGILLLIPLRRYFVKDMHGKYPFPEATASTQVLVSGQRGGGKARLLVTAGLIGGLYDFVVSTFGWWAESFSSTVGHVGSLVAAKAKLVFSINTSAALLGMGYIVGLKYAAIICLGSAAVWWVIIPAVALLFPNLEVAEGVTAAAADPDTLFVYARSIGIGGIAMAGIIGIVKSWGVIRGAFSLARKAGGAEKADGRTPRTQRDLPLRLVSWATVFTLLLVFAFFYFDVMHRNLGYALIGVVVVGVIAFLFTTVAANAIAIVGTNPVSGMTLMTLILASVIMVAVGLRGVSGMVAAMVMGGVVCTALSTAGAFVTDLKIGYWIGSTPRKQETYKFLGVLVSAATVGGVIMILNKTYGFSSGQLAAPQANAMAAVIEPLMSGAGAPWLLYGIGALMAVALTCCRVSALAFALGMFIPLELNVPLIVGGLLNWYVTTRSRDEAVNKARGEKATLLASGFIAGGALMGVVSALMRFGGLEFIDEQWLANPLSQVLSLVAYVALVVYFVLATRVGRAER